MYTYVAVLSRPSCQNRITMDTKKNNAQKIMEKVHRLKKLDFSFYLTHIIRQLTFYTFYYSFGVISDSLKNYYFPLLLYASLFNIISILYLYVQNVNVRGI